MEISSSNDGLLTNIEVFDLIETRRQQRKDNHPNNTIPIELQNRERIEMQVMKYVKSCATTNTSELVRQCLSKLKKLDLNLTEGELVQIANHVPLFPVEIHLIIEECTERLSEEQLNIVLEVLQETYASQPSMDVSS